MYLTDPTPLARRILGEGPAEAVASARRCDLPAGIAYALIPALTPGSKPNAYPSLQALVRRILRDRGTDALELKPEKLRFRDQPRDVVAVYGLDQVGDRRRFLGWAWIAGRDWRALETALDAALPSAALAEAA